MVAFKKIVVKLSFKNSAALLKSQLLTEKKWMKKGLFKPARQTEFNTIHT